MAKPEWGTKRICPNCGTRYYDLLSTPPVCPSCNTVFEPEQLLKSRRARNVAADEPRKGVVVDLEDTEVEDEVVEDVEEDDAAAPIEDVSELEDDDDDFSSVVEGDEDEN